MKILIDARLYGLEHAGLGRYTMSLINNLAESDKTNNYVVLLRRKYFDKLEFPKNWKKINADFRHYSYTEQLFLPLIVYKERPDIVHFPHFNVPLLYFGRFVVTIHDLLMHKFVGGAVTTLPLPLYWIRRLGYTLAFMKAVRCSVKVIVPTEYVKKDVIDRYKIKKDKIRTIYEGVMGSGLKADKKIQVKSALRKYNVKNPYFIYVGNVYPHKNIDRVVDAMVSLNKEYTKKVEFLIICSRSIFSEKLNTMITNKNAENFVRFLGFVEDHEMSVLLNNSIAFIYPSLEEGFGLQGLEAIQNGTILLASDIPVFREIYADNAIYFNPLETASIISAMKDVMKMMSTGKSQRIEKGQRFIKKYSWHKMASDTLDVYNEVLK